MEDGGSVGRGALGYTMPSRGRVSGTLETGPRAQQSQSKYQIPILT